MLTNNPTLVVLGGTGFVGRHVIVEAVASGRHVKALARSEESERTLSGMGAMPFRGEADDPSKWIHEADGARDHRLSPAQTSESARTIAADAHLRAAATFY
jgi:uncharacterized protein YbjT (DUF2867 family)